MDLVGLSEVAEMAGVSRQAVVNWRARFRDFPAPAAELASGPVWVHADIERWLKAREGSMESTVTRSTASGRQENREMAFSDFDRLEIASAIVAEVTTSPVFSVKVTTDESFFRHVDVTKSGATLKVRLVPGIFFRHMTVHVAISMPELRGIKLSGASRAAVTGFESAQAMDMVTSGASVLSLGGLKAGETRVSASGASRIKGVMDMSDGQIEISGASSVEVRGQGGNLRVKASGASSARLSGLSVVDMDISLSGASNATVQLKGKLNADLSGASRLTYGGEVTLGRLQVTGASSLSKG